LQDAIDSKMIDAIVQSAREAFGIPGVAVAIVRGDQTYLHGYGEKELGKGEPVTPDTLFAVGSVTKAFTTTAMAMLVDRGRMGWDDHPRKHVPGFKLSDPLADASVTLRDCVSHRTGLARHDCLWYNSKWDSQELLRKLGSLAPAFSFRSIYQYNNLMYMVAGLAIRSASGRAWDKFVRSRIFKPLGMTRSNTSVNDLAQAGDYCTPHEKKEDEIVIVPRCNVDNVAACGSIISCARDLANWVRFQLGDGTWNGRRIVSKENLSETHSPQMVVPVDEPARDLAETTITSYCLGWNLLTYRDWTVLSHGGAIDGFNAGVALVPKAGLGLAILSNLSNDLTVWAIRNAILDHLLDLPPKDWNAEIKAIQAKNREKAETAKQERAAKRVQGTQPTHELAAYAGDYADDAYGTATVSLDDSSPDSPAGKLCLTWNNHRAILEHWHFDTFAGKYEPPDWPVPIEVLFTLDSNGAIAALRLIWPESDVQRAFAKVKADR
jgi:CubicO group peptidase (beta-lactamase class C family)